MLIDIAVGSPPYIVTQSKATEELKNRMGVNPVVGRLIDSASARSGIETRRIVIPDGEINPETKFYSKNGEYISPTTSERMNLYEHWSKILTKEAVNNLLNKTNVSRDKINRLITISCTGFFAPGLDFHIISSCGLPKNIRRTNIGFMGCAASINGFHSVLEAFNSEEKTTTLLVSVELCSLHLQTEPTRDNILANMIFADGCAAVLFSNNKLLKPKMKLIQTFTHLFDSSEEFMGWKISNNGFEMMLSSELPKIIAEFAVPALKEIINNYGINLNDIEYWALHPGGRAILDALNNGLNLNDEQMFPSREVLRKYGNTSSVSILYVLKEIISSELESNKYLCAVAFGPGLTMEVAIFKTC